MGWRSGIWGRRNEVGRVRLGFGVGGVEVGDLGSGGWNRGVGVG